MLIIILVIYSIHISFTGFSADEPSSVSTFADSGGIFFLRIFLSHWQLIFLLTMRNFQFLFILAAPFDKTSKTQAPAVVKVLTSIIIVS